MKADMTVFQHCGSTDIRTNIGLLCQVSVSSTSHLAHSVASISAKKEPEIGGDNVHMNTFHSTLVCFYDKPLEQFKE